MSYLDLSLITGPFLAPVHFWTSHHPLLLPSLQPHQPYSLCSWNIAAHAHFIVSAPTLGLQLAAPSSFTAPVAGSYY